MSRASSPSGPEASRRRLGDLLRTGRISLAIAIAFLAVLTVAGHFIGDALRGHAVGEVARESLAIGGWVAMWRPLEAPRRRSRVRGMWRR